MGMSIAARNLQLARFVLENGTTEESRSAAWENLALIGSNLIQGNYAPTDIDLPDTKAIKDVKQGEYVKLVRNGQPSKKTYQRGEYHRKWNNYELIDCDAPWYSTGCAVKGDTLVFVDFEY